MRSPRRLGRAALLLLLFLSAASTAAASEADALDRDADIYLVPIGDLPDDLLPELARYYEGALGLHVELTGPLPFVPSTLNEERRQYIAEDLLLVMGKSFRGWARNPRVLFIGIIAADIYTSQRRWRFAFAVRRGAHLAVVSAARMADVFDSPGTWSRTRTARLRKMVTKTVAVQHLGLPLSLDPASLVYGRVFGPEDLDRIDESRLGRDVIEPSRTRTARLPPEDPDDLLALGHPIELQDEGGLASRRRGALVAGGILAFFCAAFTLSVLLQRRIKAAWQQVAERHGWRFFEAEGPWYSRGAWRIELELDRLPVVVDWMQARESRTRILLTRIRADVSSPHDFHIGPESLSTRIGKRFGGLQKVDIGEPGFDRARFAMCDAPDWLRDHLPANLGERQRALRARIFCESGKLELIRLQLAESEKDLLDLLQLFADVAAGIRGRRRVYIARGPRREIPARFDPKKARSPEWGKHMARVLLGIGAIGLVGALPLQRLIQTEETHTAWRIGLPWAAGFTLALTLCLLAGGGLAGSSTALRRLYTAFVLLPLIFFLSWGASGPWVKGWNAVAGRPHPQGLLGPVIEKRLPSRNRGILVLRHPHGHRLVRIHASPDLFERLRPGDPVLLDVSEGSLGCYYWLRK